MKKILLLFLLAASTAIAQKLKVTGIQPLGPYKFSATLALQNESNQIINYLSTYCSVTGFYVTDNPNVKVVPKPCDKNIPITASLPKHYTKNTELELQTLKDVKKVQFRIGFKFTEIPKNTTLFELDTTQVKSVIIWSNTIELKNR
ncbi:hypothetical protein [Flavobacterium wongokense]|uniref:hypothetical protein n=1 Tax=Flavobacterium wongokense TaxID=2910674 RepID=UPI001F21602C|nr:hypothetical protein [Flavobacterium sp. WG47]MCF6132218.1 hypothetical protein [Flavobacterium sp. WG47]